MKRFSSEIYFLILVFYVVRVESIESEFNFLSDDLRIEIEKWHNLKKILQTAVQHYDPPQSENFKELTINVNNLLETEENSFLDDTGQNESKCTRDLIYLLKNLDKRWALQMIDSYGKPGSGVLVGNAAWMGQYDECLKVTSNGTEENFHGRYCKLTWVLHFQDSENKSLPITTGVCVPDSCSPEELTGDYGKILHIAGSIPILNETFSYINMTGISCKPTSRKFTTAAIGMMCLLSFFGVFIVIGSSITAYEYFQNADGTVSPNHNFHEKDTEVLALNGVQTVSDDVLLLSSPSTNIFEKAKPFFKCFCIFTNGSKILNTDGGEGQLLCIHGIRFLSLTWVILGHTYLFCTQYIGNALEVLGMIDNFAFQIVLQGFFSVDSFFVLSGFLLTYLFFKEMTKRNGKMSWAYFYLHRYLRLTPVYMIVLGFNTTLLKYIGDGPYWPDGDTDEICVKYWWQNLLYINNFNKAENMCIGWSWYLSNDMQFYVISPLFLYTLWRWPKIGLSTIAVFLCGSCISIFVITYQNDLVPGLSTLVTDSNPAGALLRFQVYFDKVYIKPYARIGPYLIGMLLGYILFKTQDKRTLSRMELLIGWILATTMTLTVVYGLYHAHPDIWATSAYNAFNRIFYAIGVSWVIYVCLTSGGVVNKILSFKAFIPLSRLTYCAYLLHLMVILPYYQVLRQPIQFSQMTMVTLFIGLLAMSYGFAFITTVMFESPFMALEKEIMKKFKKA